VENIDISEIDKKFSYDIITTDKMTGSWYGTGHEARPGIRRIVPIIPHDEILSSRDRKLCLLYIHRKKGFSVVRSREIPLIELYEVCFPRFSQENIPSFEFHRITR
jgi:hypothetical protein